MTGQSADITPLPVKELADTELAGKKRADRELLYRLSTLSDWSAAQRDGKLIWRADDKKSGFLHLSAPHQVLATAQKHFTDHAELIILMFDSATLGEELKWELAPKRGENFPHYYGDLVTDLVVATGPLIRTNSGWQWGVQTKDTP